MSKRPYASHPDCTETMSDLSHHIKFYPHQIGGGAWLVAAEAVPTSQLGGAVGTQDTDRRPRQGMSPTRPQPDMLVPHTSCGRRIPPIPCTNHRPTPLPRTTSVELLRLMLNDRWRSKVGRASGGRGGGTRWHAHSWKGDWWDRG